MASRFHKHSSIQEFLTANKEYSCGLSSMILQQNAAGQKPHTLWISCSDSRYSEYVLSELKPGEVFTHRNIGNLVSGQDISSISILKFALNSLKVGRIMVVGHTSCGAVKTVLRISKVDWENEKVYGDNNEEIDVDIDLARWLKPLIDVKVKNADKLAQVEGLQEKNKLLSTLNVQSQVQYLLDNPVIKNAVVSNELEIYGLLYDVGSGLLDLVEEHTNENLLGHGK